MAKIIKNTKRFAKTLFNAVEFNELESAAKQLGEVDLLMKKNREIRAALVSPRFPAAEKTKAVDVIAQSLKLSPEVKKYLTFISVNGAAGYLDEILSLAISMYNERKKKAVAKVITPVQFTAALNEKMKAALKKLTSREVEIQYVTDPSLIGGVVVKIGSTMYDSSIKGQLRLLKDELIKG